MPKRWNIFRALCIVQIVLAGFQAGLSFVGVLFGPSLMSVLSTLFYTGMVLFASLGLTMVNRNYPDDPPQGSQKTYFNWLYIVNFFAIAFLLAHAIAIARSFLAALTLQIIGGLGFALVMYSLFLLMFFLHVYMLFMMFRLRRELYANYMRMIDSLGEKII